jgi:threonine synthase
VQTEACHPLAQAFEQLRSDLGDQEPTPAFFHAARQHRSKYMQSVTAPSPSLAAGILDDETYDWFAIARAMLLTGGAPVTVTEAQLDDAFTHAAPDADATGAAGLAGFLALLDDDQLALGESAAVLFTGIDRTLETP